MESRLRKLIASLNDRFAVDFGRHYSRPRYAWIRSDSKELMFPMKQGTTTQVSPGGLINFVPKYELVPLVEGEPRWVIAALVEPTISQDEWDSKYQGLEFPAKGFYVPTDIMLRPGVEPTPEATSYVSSLIQQGKYMTYSQMEEAFTSKAEREQKLVQSRVDDIIDDAAPAFANVPGTRSGGVSFGGI